MNPKEENIAIQGPTCEFISGGVNSFANFGQTDMTIPPATPAKKRLAINVEVKGKSSTSSELVIKK
jgi:hypothetical protein